MELFTLLTIIIFAINALIPWTKKHISSSDKFAWSAGWICAIIFLVGYYFIKTRG